MSRSATTPTSTARRCLVLLVAAASVVSACGGDDDAEPATTEAPATTASDGGSGSEDGSGADGSGSASDGGADPLAEVTGTLTVDGVDVEVVGTCYYSPSATSTADVSTATLGASNADGPYALQFAVSGVPERRTRVSIATPDDSFDAEWAQDGSLEQSDEQGSYRLADGTLELTVTAEGSEVSLTSDCNEV